MKLISNVENAERIKISDTSGNFVADTVEGALAEVSTKVSDIQAQAVDNSFVIAMSIALG